MKKTSIDKQDCCKSIPRLAAKLEHRIRGGFHSLGLFIGRYPYHIVILTITVTLLCSTGFIWFEEHNDVRYDYAALGSPSRYEYDVVQEFFQEFGKPFYLVVTIRSRDGGDILRKEQRLHAANLTRYLQSEMTVEQDGPKVVFDDLCGAHCTSNKPVQAFMRYYDSDFSKSPNVQLTYPTMRFLNERIYLASNFVGVSTTGTQPDYMLNCTIVVLHFRAVNSNATMIELLHKWEMAVFEYVSHLDATDPLLHVATMNEGLVSIEIRRTGMAAFPYLILSFAVIIVFALVSTLSADLHLYKPLEAVLGVLCPMMALACSFGILLWIGVDYMPVITVAPFLILAVGVDDVFIALHAWHKTDATHSPERRIAECLASSGPSITITSLTNALAFAVGACTPTPAIRNLCLYTCAAVVVAYIYQVFYFSAILAIGGAREAKRLSCCCVPRRSAPGPITMLIQNTVKSIHKIGMRVLNFWTEISVKSMTRLVIAVCMLGYWAISIYGCTTCRIELSADKLFLRDSPLLQFIEIQKRYLFKEGGQLYVLINEPGDLRNEYTRNRLFRFVAEFIRRPESAGADTTLLWLPDYLRYLSMNLNTRQFFDDVSPSFTYKALPQFVNDISYKVWSHYIRLNATACVLDQPSCIHSFAFTTGFRNATEYADRLVLLNGWRDLCAQYGEFNATIYEDMAMYADQIASIGPVYLSTVLVAILCMCLVCVLFIPHLVSIVCATMCVCSINVGVFGCMMLWGINLDPMSISTSLMSIGFAVDFTAHISYYYYKSLDHSDKKTRIRHALESIGWPMLQAGISTILAVVVLVVVKAYMIEVFVKTIFLVVLLGLIHGIVVLPVILGALPATVVPPLPHTSTTINTLTTIASTSPSEKSPECSMTPNIQMTTIGTETSLVQQRISSMKHQVHPDPTAAAPTVVSHRFHTAEINVGGSDSTIDISE